MDWQQRLAGLLAGGHSDTGDSTDAGAQLVVCDEEGREVFRAALARHYRIDDDDPTLLWIRPIIPGSPDRTTGLRVFNLNVSRRRALKWSKVSVTTTGISFSLVTGQSAVVQPATGAELSELHAWDTFVLLVLTSHEERALEALDGDTWTGRFS
ncbi:hypothetical protein [Allosalinactinospora lopnorensis]|uniref:hypothetical protein n=1 Tax=Allosalinactinospora lopnorensis TaxID=1352348 RepID=UPI000623FE53|nr:hypothetical protein [Allosalinactinospora lopnorensis]